jgi:hypothetical protein
VLGTAIYGAKVRESPRLIDGKRDRVPFAERNNARCDVRCHRKSVCLKLVNLSGIGRVDSKDVQRDRVSNNGVYCGATSCIILVFHARKVWTGCRIETWGISLVQVRAIYNLEASHFNDCCRHEVESVRRDTAICARRVQIPVVIDAAPCGGDYY